MPEECEHGIGDCVYCADEAAATQAKNLWELRLPNGETLIDTISQEMEHYASNGSDRSVLLVKAREWATRLRTLGEER